VNLNHCKDVSSLIQFLFYYAAVLFIFCSKVKQQLQTLINEIEGFKKASVEEMLKNEHLTTILKKIHSEEANLKHLIAVEEEKKGALEIQLSSVHNMLEHTDKEMQEVMLVSVTKKVSSFALYSHYI
jgi:hypothetical protein